MALQILVIEDTQEIIGRIRVVLEFLQMEYSVADNLAKGIGLIDSVKPDVILLDLKLPNGQGMEVLTKVLKAANGKAPVVVLTEHDNEQVSIEAIKMGAQDFLSKTEINASSLGRRIKYAVEREKPKTLSQQINKSLDKIDNLIDKIEGMPKK